MKTIDNRRMQKNPVCNIQTYMRVCVTDRMIDWIKQGIEKVVPQPEIHVRSKTEVNETTEAPASTKGTFSSALPLVFKQVMLWC